MAKEAGLVIVPVISKIDSPLARIEETKHELVNLLGVEEGEILQVSGRTGEGVEELLREIVRRVPAPKTVDDKASRSLIFDFKYSNHRGVIVFIRVMSGTLKKGERLEFLAAGKSFQALEVGYFSPEEKEAATLSVGEIGYIVTGIKEPGIATVGDTIASDKNLPLLIGYEKARPVVWASIYPESQDDLTLLKQALMRLRLSDSAFTFEEESSGVLGRGFRVGFLGMLHLEIITERLKREFNIPLIITLPSITYKIVYKNGKKETIYTPSLFPEDYEVESVEEPWIRATIITPPEYIGVVLDLLHKHEAELGDTETFGDARTAISFDMPLRELMRNFFDKLKSATSGFGSISYEFAEERDANVTRLDILVADEPVAAFAKVVSKRQVEEDAENLVERLYKVLPRQMFTLKIQGKALGRIISSRTLSGMKKDVTQHMYGGDITRKMKLREKQKKGKKKMKERGKVNIPQDVFIKMMKES
jgi:GTP-binding protein LepA